MRHDPTGLAFEAVLQNQLASRAETLLVESRLNKLYKGHWHFKLQT